MNTIYKIFLIIIIPILFTACEQLQLEDFESKTAVIEGFLYAGKSADSIKVSQSYSYGQLDTNVITLDNLSIFLSDGDYEYPLNPLGNGIYSNEDLVIRNGITYDISFSWNGETISAETYIPEMKKATISSEVIEMEKITSGFGGGFGGGPGGGFGGGLSTQIEPVEITWDNTEGDYYYVVLKNIEDDPEYINELIRDFDFGNGGFRRSLLISEPQTTDFYAIDPRRELTQYGTYEIILFRVNPEYAALYESSGNTSLSLEQPPTNVENGLGIFTGVSTDTLYLEVVEQ